MSRQTYNYLRNLFAHRGVAPRRRLGQNFLIDLNLHEFIVRTADVGPKDVVLEVGTGAGALTELLAERASAVVAVDVDQAMALLSTEAVSGRPNVRVINADALAGKNRLNPIVLDTVKAGLAVAPDRVFKLVANLPYAIATPLITNLLVHPELCPSSIVVTIQLELAERMLAEPGGEMYGGLSSLVQGLADAELVRTLPPSVFWPRPAVMSAIVRIVPNAAKRGAIGDVAWFHATIRRLFTHRRKSLRLVLHHGWRELFPAKSEVDSFLAHIGLLGEIRAESMNVEELVSLAAELKSRAVLSGRAAAREPDAEP